MWTRHVNERLDARLSYLDSGTIMGISTTGDSTMRKRSLILLLASLAITVSLSGVVRPSIAEANVVLVSCLVDTAGGSAFRAIRVVGASSSANAPDIPTGAQTNCAQALAVLLAGGFELISVEGGAEGAFYTFHRKN